MSVQPDACYTDFDAVSMIRGELFFFRSGYVWRIRDGHLESGYPALASRHWKGIPDNIDAAFEDKSGNIWFFQGRWFDVSRDNCVESVASVQAQRVWARPVCISFTSGDVR